MSTRRRARVRKHRRKAKQNHRHSKNKIAGRHRLKTGRTGSVQHKQHKTLVDRTAKISARKKT